MSWLALRHFGAPPPPSREELDCAPGEKVARNILLNLLPPQSGIQEVGGGEGGGGIEGILIAMGIPKSVIGDAF